MVIQSLVGGTGGRAGADGVDGRDSGLANLYNTPLERSEADAHIVVEKYGLRPDSGGAGEWRGGTGLEMRVRIMRAGTAVLGRGLERFVFRPWGVAGGSAGAVCHVRLNRRQEHERDLGKLDMFVAEKDDRITILTAGGGGFGDPFARDVAAVRRDVIAGFVTESAAARDYGVAIADGEIDVDATKTLRTNRTPPPEFGFGPERLAWEQVFDDARMSELSRRLLKLPATIRAQMRRQIMELVAPNLKDVSNTGLVAVIEEPGPMRDKFDAEIEKLPA